MYIYILSYTLPFAFVVFVLNVYAFFYLGEGGGWGADRKLFAMCLYILLYIIFISFSCVFACVSSSLFCCVSFCVLIINPPGIHTSSCLLSKCVFCFSLCVCSFRVSYFVIFAYWCLVWSVHRQRHPPSSSSLIIFY